MIKVLNRMRLSMTQVPIDKQLSGFNFYILTRGTYCSQGFMYSKFNSFLINISRVYIAVL